MKHHKAFLILITMMEHLFSSFLIFTSKIRFYGRFYYILAPNT